MISAWLAEAISRARDLRRDDAQRGVSSYQGGYDAGWVEALAKVQSVLSTEGNQTMNFFKLLKVAGEVMMDLPKLETMAAGLIKGQMPTPEDIALLMKLVSDAKAAL